MKKQNLKFEISKWDKIKKIIAYDKDSLPLNVYGTECYILEVEVFEGEMNFNDSSSFHPSPENILFRWLVILSS